MNLHKIVSGVIGSVNHHETIEVYRNTGTTNIKGKIVATYTKSTQTAQIQAPTESDLKLSERLASAEHRINSAAEITRETNTALLLSRRAKFS